MCQPVCTTTHTRWSSGSLASSGLLSLEFPAAIMQQIVLDVYKTGQEINFLGIFALEERMERRERLKSFFHAPFRRRRRPTPRTHGCSAARSAAVFGNSHSCTSTIQGIIYHRHLGTVLAGSDWCLRFSVTASSCLEPDDAPRGAVHSADWSIDRWCFYRPGINMF